MSERQSTGSLIDQFSLFITGQGKSRYVFGGFLALLFTVLYLLPAYFLPLIDMDEGAYAAVSREMMLSGQWWATMLNGEPFFHKPVFMYWAQSLGLVVFGEGRFAYRASSLIAFVIWLWCTFKFLKEYVDIETAWMNFWISFFSVGILIIFKAAIPDAWLILFISLALYAGYEFTQKGRNSYLYWAFFWTGLGILAKGPIAVVVVSGSLFIYLVIQKDWDHLKAMILSWKGWLILCAVALPWYILQTILFGQQFIDEFFGVHNIGRFMSPMESHSGNPLYYVFVLIFLSLPFFPILVKLFVPWWRASKQSQVQCLLGVWFLLVFIFFTIAATKLPHYLMYGVPPVLMAMAYYASKHHVSWGLGATLLVVSGLFAAVPKLIEFAAKDEKNPYHYATLHEASLYTPDGYYFWIGLMALVGLVLIVTRWKTIVNIFAAGLITTLTMNYSIVSYASSLQQGPILSAAEYVKKHNLELVTCCIEMPSFNIEIRQITPMRLPKQGEVVFGKAYELERKFTKVEWLMRDRGVAIARIIEE